GGRDLRRGAHRGRAIATPGLAAILVGSADTRTAGRNRGAHGIDWSRGAERARANGSRSLNPATRGEPRCRPTPLTPPAHPSYARCEAGARVGRIPSWIADCFRGPAS